eukprot:CAMPEP_0168514592 /NCGR_PEP_ID=MMETSP0405-20121227/4216_1 /TAXON_ID=498012 /ORGANISM="Trichosphaerium sp, Strain Am-I-7 wt" /LENGTH=88 /DNA_ID=CAMNT_0008533777 /DNA_START=25 /DNA_END=291 /DNA_ORIENTATION=-
MTTTGTRTTYIRADGTIGDSSVWRFDSIPRAFWDLVNGVGFFFQTLISPEAVEKNKKKDYDPNMYYNSGKREVARVRPEGEHNVPAGG